MIILTAPSIPPLLRRGREHDTLFFSQIMEKQARPRCKDCNAGQNSTIHPCGECLPSPQCTVTSCAWAPTYCKHCIKAALAHPLLASSHSPSPCRFFASKLENCRKKSYRADPFAKSLDYQAFACLIPSLGTSFLPSGEHSQVWPHAYLQKVCEAAIDARYPHEVFKLAQINFAKGYLNFNESELLKTANSTKILSPPRKSARKQRSRPASANGDYSRNTSPIAAQVPVNSLNAPSTSGSSTTGIEKQRPSPGHNTRSLVEKVQPIESSFQNVSPDSPPVNRAHKPRSKMQEIFGDKGDSQRDEEYIPPSGVVVERPVWSEASSDEGSEDDDEVGDLDRSIAPSGSEVLSGSEDDSSLHGGEQSLSGDRALSYDDRQEAPQVEVLPNDLHTNNSELPSYNPISPTHPFGGDNNPVSPTRRSSGALPSDATRDRQDDSDRRSQLPEGIFISNRTTFRPVSLERVVNTAIASIEFLPADPSLNRREGNYLISSPYMFSERFFTFRKSSDQLTTITPTQAGLNSLDFMSLFNSFREFMESEADKTKSMRDNTYNQVLALFHQDKENALKAKMGWFKSPEFRHVGLTKIPPSAADAVEDKLSPPRRLVKSALIFKGQEGTTEEAFLKSINTRHSCNIPPQASMFTGEFWDPKKASEEDLDRARSHLQRISNIAIGSQAISDIADYAITASMPKSEAEYKDLLVKIKALSTENTRLVEPSLLSGIQDFSRRKIEVRAQMVKGLKPERIRDPLMQAPIFSSDVNIFPSKVLQDMNDLALSLEDKVTLPKRAYRPKLPYGKRQQAYKPTEQRPFKRQKLSTARANQVEEPRTSQGGSYKGSKPFRRGNTSHSTKAPRHPSGKRSFPNASGNRNSGKGNKKGKDTRDYKPKET